MKKNFSSQALGNFLKKKPEILKEEDKHKKIIINENAKVQLAIVSAIKDQKPIEEVKALLQPHLPKDSLV